MLQKGTLVLLRLPFSFFLMPVFFFALSQVPHIDWEKSILVFIILHVILYPSSNGYNSYMDRDAESIGLLETPPMPTKELFYLTALLDVIAILMSFLINTLFLVCIIANILASRAYSYRGIRLKRYPVVGFLTVVIFQGAVTYFMVYHGSGGRHAPVPWQGMLISTLLFGGFYPLTQIYQHDQDLKDGVRTISYMLGLMGTFIFSGILYLMAELWLFLYFKDQQQLTQFWLITIFFIPVITYFFFWWKKVKTDQKNASFRYALNMNIVAAVCTNAAFITLLIVKHHPK